MSAGKVYTNEELRFFRLGKCVVDHSSAALRKAFKRNIKGSIFTRVLVRIFMQIVTPA